MIVDAHTHIFPASFIEQREALVRREPLFAELYADPRARMVTAAGLIETMDQDGIDHAVIAGFAWQNVVHCRKHNDTLLTEAARSGGRFSAFCAVPATPPEEAVIEMQRCATAGARGFGELRADMLVDGPGGMTLLNTIAEMAVMLELPLLLHASEPVGHTYPGKVGGSLGVLWSLLAGQPSLVTILAHLGGGLPFYAHMPEVRAVFQRTYVDTAAVPWLYDASAYRAVMNLIGAERLIFGSDYPLRRPARDLTVLREAGLTDGELAAMLGGNAARLLGLVEEVS